MRIGFEYKQAVAPSYISHEVFQRKELLTAACRVYDLDTGKDIPMVQSVHFRINAEDMVPYLQIELVPASVTINSNGYTTRELHTICDPQVRTNNEKDRPGS